MNEEIIFCIAYNFLIRIFTKKFYFNFINTNNWYTMYIFTHFFYLTSSYFTFFVYSLLYLSIIYLLKENS